MGLRLPSFHQIGELSHIEGVIADRIEPDRVAGYVQEGWVRFVIVDAAAQLVERVGQILARGGIGPVGGPGAG